MIVRTQSPNPIEPIVIVDGWVWLHKDIEETEEDGWVADEVCYRLQPHEATPTLENLNITWAQKTEDRSFQAQIDDLNDALVEIAGLL